MRPLLYTVICISINAILNGRLKDLIFLFKIPIGTWKSVLEIYKQFGHVPYDTALHPRRPTQNNIYEHSYFHIRSLILFMPNSHCWSRSTAPHKEAHNMTINQWTTWHFTVHCQLAYWEKQLTFPETFNRTWILDHRPTATSQTQ